MGLASTTIRSMALQQLKVFSGLSIRNAFGVISTKPPMMKLAIFSSLVLGMASGAAAALIVKKIFFKREKESIQGLFFSPGEARGSCTTEKCEKLSCPLCNFRQLCTLLKATKHQLYVCMYLITEPEISKILLELHQKGVKVRIIMDKQMSEEALKSKSGLFYKYKIPVNYVNSNGMMHNKFFIIDQKIVVSGSPNWTIHAFMSNYENMLIVKSRRMSKLYGEYFNSLWFAHQSTQT